MSYWTVAVMADDEDLRRRVAACAAQEQALGAPIDADPTTWTWTWRLTWAASPGWADAWEYVTEPTRPDRRLGADGSART